MNPNPSHSRKIMKGMKWCCALLGDFRQELLYLCLASSVILRVQCGTLRAVRHTVRHQEIQLRYAE